MHAFNVLIVHEINCNKWNIDGENSLFTLRQISLKISAFLYS